MTVNQYIYQRQKQQYTQTAAQPTMVGAGFVVYHKRIHAESIHMPDTSTVFQAKIEAISHAYQYTLANLKELNINYIKNTL